ncbi:unnamed protein product [Rotaria sp. Silwood1]|nr:unnamed protein product [Rotaria sp. Silwood1]CAF1626228.1 unnamed protein product [Rotaria sp. Silwood1]
MMFNVLRKYNRKCCNLDRHQYEAVCGQIMNCGIHTCKKLCHPNFCPDCSLFYQEKKCNCGETIIKPKFTCHKPYLKCYVQLFCNQPCGKLLPCTIHTCQRSCQSFDEKCIQPCNIKRRICGHPCNLPCHGDEPCPVTICNVIITIQCPCGNLEKDIICNVKPNETNEEKNGICYLKSISFGKEDPDINLTSQIEALEIQIKNLSFARKPPQLECDDECRVIQQNSILTSAFSNDCDQPQQIPNVYTDFLLDYAKKNLEFIQNIEQQFTQLVEDTQAARRFIHFYSFAPMKYNKRHVIHELASFYGVKTNASGPEPNRKVIVCASCSISIIPSVTLSKTVMLT